MHYRIFSASIKSYHPSGTALGGIVRGCSESVTSTGESLLLPSLNLRQMLNETYSSYVQIIFSTSQHLKSYDVFRRQKESTLLMSRRAVEELAHQFISTVAPKAAKVKSTAAYEGAPDDAAAIVFREMTELALWGNATDLSLLTNLTLEEIQRLQTKKVADDRERSIVDNDWVEACKLLQKGRSMSSLGSPRRVDIILDNAGFELYTDVLYAAYMLEADLASEVVLHAKSFPWFVSDVTPNDFDMLIKTLDDPSVFPDREDLDRLTACIKAHLNKDTIKLQVHPFWTTHFSFDALPVEAPELMEQLQQSYLTIWKGDLNYRKLTRDGLWPHTTAFKTALGRLGQGSGVRIFALRTNKSDTCVGVSAGRLEELEKEAPGKAWVRNGKYAVMSFSDGT